VEVSPDDFTLRLHLAEMLAESGENAEAVRQAAAVLQHDPTAEGALRLIAQCSTPQGQAAQEPELTPADRLTAPNEPPPSGQSTPTGQNAPLIPGSSAAQGTPAAQPRSDRSDGPFEKISEEELLRRLDSEFIGVVPPMFIESYSAGNGDQDDAELDDDDREADRDDDYDFLDDDDDVMDAFSAEVENLTLADVAGMDEVKARLEAAVLAPIRNPDLVRLYGKSLRGGLLLYGPPGCGKTFIARALAGEMGAKLLAVSLADVLDMYVGQSERNLRAIFEIARHNAPCVIFLDEIDALGQKRTQLRGNASRGTVNQLLTEMDGLASDNEGVYVLGATNQPWDVDIALRRPGRFDRMVLVLPPDEKAREAVLRYSLRDRPIAGVDPRALARLTDGYSGADLAFVCESAAERALVDSVRTGRPRMIEMCDLEAAVKDVRPSIGPWLQTARNVAEFANADGSYDDLLAYLRARKLA
jgi:SpoVK/Ycf46/Vps4 family AAA+-type ATPase